MTFYVYILRCADGTYYTGHTDDLDARMAQHSDGVASAYTSKRRPLELLWATDCQSRAAAFDLERRLHGWSRAKKEALMRGDYDALPALSRNRLARLQRDTLRQAQGERAGGDVEEIVSSTAVEHPLPLTLSSSKGERAPRPAP
jgi:predicted GIY-YIG superfamily endonuclease